MGIAILGYVAVSIIDLELNIESVWTITFNIFAIIVIGISVNFLAIKQAILMGSQLDRVKDAERLHLELTREILLTEPFMHEKVHEYNRLSNIWHKKELCFEKFNMKWEKYFTDDGILKNIELTKEEKKNIKIILKSKIHYVKYEELKSTTGNNINNHEGRKYGKSLIEVENSSKISNAILKTIIGVMGGAFIVKSIIDGNILMAIVQMIIFIIGACVAFIKMYIATTIHHPETLKEKDNLLIEIRKIKINKEQEVNNGGIE